MKRHYYIIGRNLSHDVMAFNSVRDIEKWFAVEPVYGYVPDIHHQDVEAERDFRCRYYIGCSYDEARYWLGSTINHISDYEMVEDLYTGIMHTRSLY